ncbi:hypothetical protein D3C83_248300 [compost metagenome]
MARLVDVVAVDAREILELVDVLQALHLELGVGDGALELGDRREQRGIGTRVATGGDECEHHGRCKSARVHRRAPV